MITDQNLPDGWIASSESEPFDQMMDREFESVLFEHENGDAEIRINEVQEPKDFEGWGYQVTVEHGLNDDSGTSEEKLGVFEDLDEARATAIDQMDEFEP